jgi:hypothetical protein
MLTTDEQLLLLLSVAYLGAVALLLWRLAKLSNALLRIVHSNVSPEFWESIGAPRSAQAAACDPQRRWMRFVRSGAYRTRCPPRVVEAIDEYRRQSNWTMIGLTGFGVLIVYQFWPILEKQVL